MDVRPDWLVRDRSRNEDSVIRERISRLLRSSATTVSRQRLLSSSVSRLGSLTAARPLDGGVLVSHQCHGLVSLTCLLVTEDLPQVVDGELFALLAFLDWFLAHHELLEAN